MAGLDGIYKALTQADQVAAADNPYVPFQGVSDDLSKALMQHLAEDSGRPDAFRHYSTGDAIGAALINGLISGATHELGDNSRASQNDLARSVLSDSLAGKTVLRPDGMNPSVFSNLQNSASVFQAQQKLEQQDEARKSIFANPEKVLTAKMMGIDLPGMAGLSTSAALPLEADATGAPQLQDYVAKAGGDLTLARQMMKEDYDKSLLKGQAQKLAAVYKLEPAIADSFSTPGEVRDYLNQRRASNKDLPTQVNGQLTNMISLDATARKILPLVHKIESALPADGTPVENALQVAIQSKVIPASDLKVLQAEFPTLSAAIAQASSTGRVPLAEMHALDQLMGNAPVARGELSSFLIDNINGKKKGFEQRVRSYDRADGIYQQAAQAMMDGNASVFAPLESGPSREDAIAELQRRKAGQ